MSSWGFTVQAAEDGKKAVELIESFEPHVLLLDLKLPFTSGLEILEEIRRRGLPIVVIVVSGDGDIPEAVRAIKLGAYDYLRKPIDPPRLRLLLSRLCEHMRLGNEEARVKAGLKEGGQYQRLVGQSAAMRHVVATIEQAAPTDASLIIYGESGTGKEVVARAIHELSLRRNGPYIAVNCAALPDALLESELFGYERGAFTGADQRRVGCFEMANGGTLLLDEIAEMRPELQAKLLRVLEERRLRRLGGVSDIALDVRVLAATNNNLLDALREGRLREDLYYRINVFTIALPSLNARVEDIPLLAQMFIREFAENNRKSIAGADQEFIETLQSRTWPGNVRELRNAIERAVIVSRGPLLTVRDLDACTNSRPSMRLTGASGTPSLPVGLPLKDVERELILQTLSMVGGNRLRAAKTLRISPKTLYNKLERYCREGAIPASLAKYGFERSKS